MAAHSSFAINVPDELLAAVQAGDRVAFEQLYRLFERPVFTLALRMLGGGNREEAHDVLQETMLKVLGSASDFTARGGSPFWGWLRQIAVNEALTQLRRNRKFAHEVALPHDEFAEDHGPLPPAAADAAILQRAMSALPATTRSVLWLYHAEGYTHDEIAALMQRTPSFSKSQLARGGRRLRALLEGQPEPANA